MSPYFFQIDHAQSEHIVIEELKLAVYLNLEPNIDEGGYMVPLDWELINSLLHVLKYFMTVPEYEEISASVERIKNYG